MHGSSHTHRTGSSMLAYNLKEVRSQVNDTAKGYREYMSTLLAVVFASHIGARYYHGVYTNPCDVVGPTYKVIPSQRSGRFRSSGRP